MLTKHSSSALKRLAAVSGTIVNEALNSSGDGTHLPEALHHMEHIGVLATVVQRRHVLSCSCNADKPPPGFSVALLKRATTANARVPSADIYALVRLMKHEGKRVSLVVTDSWSYRGTNITLTVERCGFKLRCSALRICCSSLAIVTQAAHHDVRTSLAACAAREVPR